MKNRKPKSQEQKRIDGISGGGNYTAGNGIEIIGNTVSLKPADYDISPTGSGGKLGGVYLLPNGSFRIVDEGRLLLNPAGKERIGGVIPSSGIKVDSGGLISVDVGIGLYFGEDGKINVKEGFYGGYVSPPSQITIQGYKAYELSYLMSGHIGEVSNQYYYFPFGWLYYRNAITQYMEINGDFYQLKAGTEEGKDRFKIYMEIKQSGTTSSTFRTYKESESGVKSDCTESVMGYVGGSSAEIGSGIALCWERLFSPGTEILGDQYENGCALITVFSFCRINSSGDQTVVARRGNGFIVPFATVDEYNAAIGGEEVT